MTAIAGLGRAAAAAVERVRSQVAPVVHLPHPALATPSEPVVEFDVALRVLVAGMADSRVAYGGVGLAACQLGVPARVFVLSDTAAGVDMAVVNPTLEWSSDETEDADEGCLSLPGATVQVRRASAVRLRCSTAEGDPVEVELEGYAARVAQHELDHLEGRTIVDRVSRQQRRQALRRYEAHMATPMGAAARARLEAAGLWAGGS